MEWSVNVNIRIKPLTELEKVDERNRQWKEMYGDTITLNNERLQEPYTFDHVFNPDK